MNFDVFWLLGAVSLVVVAWVFWPLTQLEVFHLDDPTHLSNNREIRSGETSELLKIWLHPDADAYTPITRSVWLLESRFAGQGNELSARAFHRGNLLVHLACVALVLFLVWSITRSAAGAVMAGLLFGLHPIQVEAVAWITGLRDLLAALFSLLSALYYVQHCRNDSSGKWLALIFYLAALLSKPSAVGVPLIWAAIGVAFFRRRARDLLADLVPCLLLLPLVGFQASAFSTKTAAVVPRIPLSTRPLIALDAITSYLAKIFLPFSLGIDYGRAPRAVLASPGVFLTATLPLLLLFWAYFRRRTSLTRAFSVAAIVSLAALVSSLGFLPFIFQHISTTADRYFYLAMIGPAGLVGWITARKKIPGFAIGSVALCFLATLTEKQLKTWETNEALYTQALTVNPHSWFAHHGLSAHYLRTRDFERALWHHRRFAELVTEPEKSPRAWQSLGALQMELGHPVEAIYSLERAKELRAYPKTMSVARPR